jgi:hypothetical protein
MALRVWGYKQGEVVSLMIHLGDRLGIYRALDGAGPVTAEARPARHAAPGSGGPCHPPVPHRRRLLAGQEIRAGETWQENLARPVAAMLYGNAVASCLPSRLSEPGGAGAGAENLVRPGGSCRGREWRCSGRVAPGWFLPGGSVGCGMMIGCADATGLSECEERVRVTAFATGE